MLAEIDWNAMFEMPMPLFLCMGLVLMVAIIAPQWSKVGRSRNEARLKEKMIERGYSADEIERVTRAGVNEESDLKSIGDERCVG